MADVTRDEVERLVAEYRARFGEGAPRYAYEDDREYARAMRRALDRGSPITLEEAYGEKVAAGIRQGDVVV